MILAFEIAGHALPNPGIGFGVGVLVVGFFLINRSGAPPADEVETGIEHECPRCGYHYKPEHVALFENGETQHTYKDQCPHCTWDFKRGDPDKEQHHF